MLLGPGDVDLLGALGDAREQADAVGQHLGEAESHRQVELLAALAVPHLSHAQAREQRRVAGQDPEVALGAGQLHLVDVLGDEGAVGGDDFERQMGWY